MNEPSVLDYVKSKIFFWRGEIIEIPPAGEVPIGESFPDFEESTSLGIDGGSTPGVDSKLIDFPSLGEINISHWRGWWAITPLLLGLMAQLAFEPPDRFVPTGLVMYLIMAGILVWANLKGKISLPETPEQTLAVDALNVHSIFMWASLAFGLLAFLAFGGNRFTQLNLFFWFVSLGLFFAAFWQPTVLRSRVRILTRQFVVQGIKFSPWKLLLIAIFGLAAFYRFYLLDQVPSEMFSDHAEKLLDVADVLSGQFRIFFPRNTGREAIQMYLTAAVSVLFGTGLSFLSLKIGTAFAGLCTLPFIYLLGKEVANRRVGLFAMAFAGVAYWPNVISRVALRFALYPLFTAPVLYFLVRGLRRGTRNDFLLAGLFLGIGLHGYSPYRFVPFVVLLAIGLYLLHQHSNTARQRGLWGGVILVFTSLLVFLPLLRYALSNMDMFSYRMMTRMTGAEVAIVDPVWQIFLNNLWKAMVMFFWDNGAIWVHSIPGRPALGVISAALFFMGIVLVIIRYVRLRSWLDLFLLLSIPMLLMPSILSLAFPAENPSLNRTGGAYVPVFLLVGLALDGLMTTLKGSLKNPAWGQWLAWGVAILLFAGSSSQNYRLVFKEYRLNFSRDVWNTSELGAVIRQFADTIGSEETAWVVPYPHWVDTRLVGIRAGVPLRDYALWPDELYLTQEDPRTKLFLFKPEDAEAMNTLRDLYPLGSLKLYDSKIDGRDFYLFFVPPVEQ